MQLTLAQGSCWPLLSSHVWLAQGLLCRLQQNKHSSTLAGAGPHAPASCSTPQGSTAASVSTSAHAAATGAAAQPARTRRKLELDNIPMFSRPARQEKAAAGHPAAPAPSQQVDWRELLARARAEQQSVGGTAMLTDTFRCVGRGRGASRCHLVCGVGGEVCEVTQSNWQACDRIRLQGWEAGFRQGCRACLHIPV